MSQLFSVFCYIQDFVRGHTTASFPVIEPKS